VKDACSDILKKGQRNMRYLLKKKYFNGVPASQVRTTSPVASMTDEQWRKLVEMWSNPKHKVYFLNIACKCLLKVNGPIVPLTFAFPQEKCLKLKDNREKVKLQQKTGSRSYIAHCYAVVKPLL
jgi:hypothetical protein